MDYDLIVAGSGLAGALSLYAALKKNPQLKALLLEKEDILGGRLSFSEERGKVRYHGLNMVSPKMTAHLLELAKERMPEADGSDFLGSEFGIFLRKEILKANPHDLFDENLMRHITQSAKSEIRPVTPSFNEEQTAAAFLGQFKSAQRHYIESVAQSFMGITNFSKLYTPVLINRWQSLEQGLYTVSPRFLDGLYSYLLETFSLEIEKNSAIREASFHDERWLIQTTEKLSSKKLIIGQSLWSSSAWLADENTSKILRDIVSFTKPVSSVSLSESSEHYEELPNILWFPKEQACMVRCGRNVSFRMFIDYEVSLDAPSVVKAIKSLKRARNNLLKAKNWDDQPMLYTALVPFAWPQPFETQDAKRLMKITYADLKTNNRIYCGDMFGSSFDPDENLINSTHLVTSWME